MTVHVSCRKLFLWRFWAIREFSNGMYHFQQLYKVGRTLKNVIFQLYSLNMYLLSPHYYVFTILTCNLMNPSETLNEGTAALVMSATALGFVPFS